MYLSGCGLEESVEHMFLGYAFYGSIWLHRRQWLGIHLASLLHLDHLIQFEKIGGDSKKIGLCSTYCPVFELLRRKTIVVFFNINNIQFII